MRPEDILREKLVTEEKNKLSVYDDLGSHGFKVQGIGKRIADVIKEIRVAATKRRRGKLLENKDIKK